MAKKVIILPNLEHESLKLLSSNNIVKNAADKGQIISAERIKVIAKLKKEAYNNFLFDIGRN